MADYQTILQVVREFNRITYGTSKVWTRYDEIQTYDIPTILKEKHFHEEVSFQNSYHLSVQRLPRWPGLEKNTVFKLPRHLLWLQRDGILVSPDRLDCYIVHLAYDPPYPEHKGLKWAIFSDGDPYHFFEKCLEVYVEPPPPLRFLPFEVNPSAKDAPGRS